jgi:hypothetical protein
MDRHARLIAARRYLRIALSSACGLLCLLLIAFWVLSYDRLRLRDYQWSPTRSIVVGGAEGRIALLDAPSNLTSAWRNLSDANVDVMLLQDPTMLSLAQQLAYAEMSISIHKSPSSRGSAGISRKIEQIKQQIQHYRDHMRVQADAANFDFQVLTHPQPPTGSTLSKAVHRLGFAHAQFPTGRTLVIPCWFPTVLTGLLAALQGMKPHWRFSLRTLLIGITVVAVALGLLIAF